MLLEGVRIAETQFEIHSYATNHSGGLKVKSSSISLSRYDNIEHVKRLDERGQFEVKRAVLIDAERMRYCQAKICDNLRKAHNERGLPS